MYSHLKESSFCSCCPCASRRSTSIEDLREGQFKTKWKSIWISTIVAFIGSIQASCLTPSVWPYMQQVDKSSTETYYGILRSCYSLGNVIAAAIAGYLSNRFSQTKTAMIIAKIIAIISCLAFILIEIITSIKMALFLIFQLLLGTSVGTATVYRTHIAMASTEEDRPKAVGISQLANALGFVGGAVLQMAFSGIQYPGLSFLFGTHLNLYTAPVYLSILISIIGVFLLFFFFDGKMPIQKPRNGSINSRSTVSNKSTNSKNSFISSDQKIPYDRIAVAVCILSNLALGLVTMISTTILPTYSMVVFQWTSEESVLYTSITMGSIGVLYIFWNIEYMFCKLGQRLSGRVALIVAFLVFFLFYIFTFPWPFLGGSIGYERNVTTSPNVTEVVGCKLYYSWCGYTPPVNIVVYHIAVVLTQGIALPLAMINLDILYSKILGPIKQGTLQGIFSAAGELLAILGPFGFSQIYVASGTRYIWIAMMAVTGLCLALWLIFFKRMISYTDRIQKMPRN